MRLSGGAGLPVVGCFPGTPCPWVCRLAEAVWLVRCLPTGPLRCRGGLFCGVSRPVLRPLVDTSRCRGKRRSSRNCGIERHAWRCRLHFSRSGRRARRCGRHVRVRVLGRRTVERRRGLGVRGRVPLVGRLSLAQQVGDHRGQNQQDRPARQKLDRKALAEDSSVRASRSCLLVLPWLRRVQVGHLGQHLRLGQDTLSTARRLLDRPALGRPCATHLVLIHAQIPFQIPFPAIAPARTAHGVTDSPFQGIYR